MLKSTKKCEKIKMQLKQLQKKLFKTLRVTTIYKLMTYKQLIITVMLNLVT